jgi:hypothetical protein
MAHSEEKNLSVYEFIYVDWRRVASLIAQMDPNGVMTALETTSARDKAVSLDLETAGEAGIPLVKKGSLGATLQGQAGYAASVNKSFDASDIAPQTLLSLLDHRGMIFRDASKGTFGSIALMRGNLHILDLGMISESWHQFESEGEQGFGAVAGKREYWQLGASSILTHGHHIAGKWSILGVISKMPEAKSSNSKANSFPDGHRIPTMLEGMDELKQEVGCPDDFYAVTPLLCFRAIGVNAGT